MGRFRSLAAIAFAATLLSACSGDLGGESSAGTGGPSGPDYLPADGVTITEVAIYQGVERVLMKDGAAPAGVPVVAGRDALVRVFYSTDAKYDGAPVLGRLTIGDGPPLEVAGPLGKISKRDALGSTLSFAVKGALMSGGAGFKVEILRNASQASGSNSAAVHPAAGQQILGAVSTGKSLRIVLVPVRYNADKSGRLPDTTAGQLKIYRDALFRIYPVAEVDIRVAEPFDWSGAINGNGNGWVELLNAMTKLRQTSSAAFDEHYYGVFRATETFEQFCNGTCLAGLSQIAPSPMQAWSRVGIGLGFAGEGSGETAAHEIGHEQGRSHAPCGTAQGVDSSYPYQGGVTGGWGYDLIGKQLIPPMNVDLMSYCKPKWISDYNYGAVLTRLQAVNAMMALAGAAAHRYERVMIAPDGKAKWLEPLDLDIPPLGAPEPVQLETLAGVAQVDGYFFAYSHLPGGIVLVRSPDIRPRALVLRGAMLRR